MEKLNYGPLVERALPAWNSPHFSLPTNAATSKEIVTLPQLNIIITVSGAVVLRGLKRSLRNSISSDGPSLQSETLELSRCSSASFIEEK
ncbi:hypothetical protein AOLI_G00079440 [Acnodon oligacanthus]